MWPFKSQTEAPIQNLDRVDVVAVQHDGTVVLGLVVSGRLDASPEHQTLLLDKIQNYLAELNTPEFRAEFHNPRPEQVQILIHFDKPPHPAILQLIEKSKPWVAKNNARLVVDQE